MRARHWYRDSGLQARMIFVYLMLTVLYGAFVGALLYAGAPVILVVVIAGGLLFVQYFFSDKMVLASMGAHEVTAEQAPELHTMVGRLAQQMNLPMPRVALMQTDMPNAFATGRSPKNAVVCVTTGILDRLEHDEMEAVLAHEMSHIKNRDVQVITLASFFATVAQYIVQFSFYFGGAFNSRDSDNRSSGYGMIIALLASILTWIVSFFLIRALSRYRELAADRGSAVVTGSPTSLISALQRIQSGVARIPDQDLRRVSTMNAFFICPAIRGLSLTELTSTHPSLERRVAQLQQIQRQMEGVA